MSYQDFLNQIRYTDNQLAKWLMRHFYFTFFQAVLLIIFLFWFINMFGVIDVNVQAQSKGFLEQIQAKQLTNTTLLVVLLILNSFWLLFIFNIQQRILHALRDLSYQLTRGPRGGRPHDNSKD